MTLRIDDKWVWDFWLAHDRDQHHIFYLQAPRSLGDPERRHRNASIGHAVSTDLQNWRVLSDALHPGEPGAWDDLATWTGSVIQEDSGRWHMLYTGISTAEDGLVQRVGLATSMDLIHWEKHHANPVIEADARWYEHLDLTRWRDQSWRDPWLFRTGEDDYVHTLLTARVPGGPADGAGVIAHARSQDFVHWEVLPPVTPPGEFAQAEAPELVATRDGYAIVISCLEEDHSFARRQRPDVVAQTGSYLFVGEARFGTYTPSDQPLVSADREGGTLYAAKLVPATGGGYRFLAFRGDDNGEFRGEIIDPLPAQLDDALGVRVLDNSTEARPALAPELRSLIDWGSEVGRRYGDLPLPRLRGALGAEHDQEMRRLGMEVEQVANVSDHVIPVDGGEISIRLFSPNGAVPHPVFVHFHGGGFVFGTINSVVNDAKCAHICNQSGCAVATVEYRLAPEHRYPTAAEDCYAALEFVAENAADLGLDPARIAVGGESAGGNLAAAVALMARDRHGPRLALQLLEVPVVDVTSSALAGRPSAACFATGFGLDRSEMEMYDREYLGEDADGRDGYASPLLASDLAGLPPAHVMTAEYDVLRDAGEEFARQLREADVSVTLQRMRGHIHGSPVLWPSWEPARQWMATVVQALIQSLHEDREEVA